MSAPPPSRPCRGKKSSLDCDSLMTHSPSCAAALVAGGDRGLPTPTSVAHTSTTQRGCQAEEDRQVRVPTQQPIHQLPARPKHLARQAHERAQERLELQPQHPRLLLT